MSKVFIIQIGSEWLLLSATFMALLELVFTITQENAFSQRFHFKANRKSIGSTKAVLETSGIFFVTITGNYESLQYFNYETNFLKKKKKENHFLKKLESSFVVESTTKHIYTKQPSQKPRLLLVESLVIVFFYMIFLMCYAIYKR